MFEYLTGKDGGRVYARRNRSVVGKVSLGILLAFVLAVNPLMVCGVSAASAPPLASSTVSEVTVDVYRRITLPVSITPLTAPFVGTVKVTLSFRNASGQSVGDVGEWVYETTANAVYKVFLPDVVYEVPSAFGVGTKFGPVFGNVTVEGTTIQLLVYLDEIAEYPSEPGVPGAGQTGAGQIGGTTGTDTGWQTYNPSTDTSTVYVDPEKTEAVFKSAPATGVVLVEAPPVGAGGTVPKNVTASLPLAVVNQGGSASVPSVLKMGSIEMTLSPQVMQSLGQSLTSAAGAISSLRVKVQTSTQQVTDDTLKSIGEDLTGLTPVSQVITVTFVAVDIQGRETVLSVDRISVSVLFNPDVVKDPEKVNLYIIGSLIYVGGKVDLANNKVVADLTNFKGGRFVALEYDKTFSDIAGHWAQKDVELMASKYVVKGMTDTEFAPDSTATRAQFVTLLVRSLGLAEEKPAASTFKDVELASWYYGYVEAAYKAGLASGDSGSGGPFRPEATVSREEMAALLVRAMKQGGKSVKDVEAAEVKALLDQFTDSTSVSEWAKTEVSQSVNEGLIKGHANGQFDPLGNGTRAEAATMMSRFMKQIGKL
jgi:hypothetical protein